MKITKVLIIIVILVILTGAGFLVFSVYSRLINTEYQFQVDAVLSAAAIANEEDPLTTDPSKCVIAEYEGKRTVIVPGNYTALSSWLRKDSAATLFSGPDKSKALKVTVCDEAVFYISPAKDSVDIAMIELTTMGRTFRIHTKGGNQWTSLLACCTKGTYHDDNIPLN
jgi:hypothetical protein